MTQSLKRLFLLTLFGLTIASCATAIDPALEEAGAEPLDNTASTGVQPPVAEVEIDYGSFTQEQLYEAIISELSAQRGDLESAGQSYFDLAFATRDLGIIQRAVQFASANNDLNGLLQLGLLWSEVSPTDPQPHLLLSFQFLDAGDFGLALSHMTRVLDLGGNFDFSILSTRTGRMTPQTRAGLINNLRQLTNDFPEQDSIRIALVQLLGQNQQFTEALVELEVIKLEADPTAALVMLEAQLHQSLEQTPLALRTLKNGVRQFELDKTLRLNYARLLVQDDQFDAAQQQFQIMIEQDPLDWETHYSIALLDLEMMNYDNAAATFRRLIDADQKVDESQFYLGYVYELQEQFELAIEHYRLVRIGTTNFLTAQQQATRFSIQAGALADAHQWLDSLSRGQPRLEVLFNTIESSVLIQEGYNQEAKALLDTALNRYPNDADLLFARVEFFDSIKDRVGSENDLRQIIKIQPEDSRALNHLGYMLADQTTRFDEALELLTRAIAIAPDDPAIIDSLAWAQYKLGLYEEALVNLRRAYAEFPDHEVASHLGEVLWVMGRETEARQVWQEALQTRPDSELIKAVMERLAPSL